MDTRTNEIIDQNVDYKAECSRLKRERDEAREKYHQICSQTLIEINKAHEERDEARARVEIITPNENNPVAKFFSSSNTPETDAETNYCDAMPDMPWVDAEVARKLERERNEAREEAELLRATLVACESRITDGGYAESDSGQVVYEKANKTLEFVK